METEFGGSYRVASSNELFNRTNFAFYSIKILLETLERAKGEIGTRRVWKLIFSYRVIQLNSNKY